MGHFDSLNGYTLVEVLIVLAILTVIFGFAIEAGSNFYGGQSLSAERDSLTNLLKTARNQAMNNIDESSHGVYIVADKYILFEGNSYAARKQDFDSVFTRSKAVDISGLTEVVFNAPQGDSDSSGTITISNGNGAAVIRINNEGRIDW